MCKLKIEQKQKMKMLHNNNKMKNLFIVFDHFLMPQLMSRWMNFDSHQASSYIIFFIIQTKDLPHTGMMGSIFADEEGSITV